MLVRGRRVLKNGVNAGYVYDKKRRNGNGDFYTFADLKRRY